MFCVCSDQQGPSAHALLSDNEQERRLHLDPDLRDRRLQHQERRRAEHHLRELRAEVN